MDERLQFVRDAASDRFTMSELCARYGVSRRVGYKWIARYDAEGRAGLADRSRAPHHRPHAIAPKLAELLVAARAAHPHWGARKLLKVLSTKHPRITQWRGGNRYDIHFETLADFSAVDRRGRSLAVQAAMVRYAELLEQYCYKAPYNWFNFFDFWKTPISRQTKPSTETQ